jgi:SAM-dependent methyltransferase
MKSAAAVSDPASLEPVSCYYCGESACTDLVMAQDDLTGKPGNFRFVTCDRCGLAYQTPRIPIEHIPEWYDGEYISHRKKTNWGPLTWFYNRAMNKHDVDKDRLISRYAQLGPESHVIDVGCGAGTFLARIAERYHSQVEGVDFKNLSHLPSFREFKFHQGLFYEQNLPDSSFDLVTMWHFLEHDYDPFRTLATARRILKDDGRLVIEVPRLDSLSFRLFRERWPGLQAPQHTVLFTKEMLLKFVERAGFELIEYLPYGAFPPYFYLFTGMAFKFLKGKGLNLGRAIYPYFAGQLLLFPLLLFERRLNLAMQTVVCRRPA